MDYDHSKIKIFASYEAPLGAVHFILFDNNKFKVQRFELFKRENFNGVAKIKGDSIFLEYEDKNIDFELVSLPKKMKIKKKLINTKIGNEPYYLVIREILK